MALTYRSVKGSALTSTEADANISTLAAADATLQANIDAITPSSLGLGNVDNTSDANKPVSTAQAAADALVLSTAQTYADSLVIGLWDDRGNYNASVNTFPASGGSGSAGAVKKGDIWTVSVAGTLGGHAVTAGDTVRALIDTPGQTDSNWAIAENNIGYVAENSANKSSDVNTDQASTVKYPTVKAVYDWAVGLFQTIANKDATGGYAGLTLFKINFKNVANTFTSFFTNSNTAARTYTFQDRNGTIADDTDLGLFNRAYVALTDAASISIPFFTIGVANYTWSSARTAVTFTFTGDTNASEAYIILTKTTASNLVLTLPAASLITDQNGTEVVGLAVTLTSTASGVFEIYLKKTAAGYRAIIKRNVA